MAAHSDPREQLLQLLKKKSYRRGKVVLSSGKVSDFYVDCKQTSLSAQGHLYIGRVLFELIRERFPQAEAVGGPTLGADPMISAISTISAIEGEPMDAFIIRKEAKGHGTEAWIEGMGNLAKGMKVVVVEDVITTGGSTIRAIEKCRDAGLDVVGSLVLVDRQEGGREAIVDIGCPVESLFCRSDFD